MFTLILLDVIFGSLKVMFLVVWPVLKWFMIIIAIAVVIGIIKGFIHIKTKK